MRRETADNIGLFPPDRWQRVKRLFDQAVAKPDDTWEAFLNDRCDGDKALHQAVERMLVAHKSAGAFLESPALGEDFHIAKRNESASPILQAGDKIDDRYVIVRLIAGGGMGFVYEAVQKNPRRKVAVKVLKTGIASRAARRSFEYESQVLARLKHPGIAQVLEATTVTSADGELPCFVLEYIENAENLTTFAQRKTLGTRERLALFIHVCDAAHFAHQRGVIHRDIKPANILVDPAGAPRLIDFGVACGIDGTSTSVPYDPAHLVGTLQYMSPEQCDGSDAVDSRADVYSLGVVLFELLTGERPYEVAGTSFLSAARVVCEQPPRKPSHKNDWFAGDLEAVMLKAVEKDPRDRYQSVDALAKDIDAFLNNRPVAARLPSTIYHLRKWSQRHRAVAALSAALVLLAAAASASLAVQSINLARERDTAVREAAKAKRVSAFLQSILAYGNPKVVRHDMTMLEVIEAAAERISDDLGDDPEVEAEVRRQLGQNVYWPMSRFDDAKHQMLAALALDEARLGSDHPGVISQKNCLAELLLFKGDVEMAQSFAEQAISALPTDSYDRVYILDNLARIAVSRKQFDAAERFIGEALDLRLIAFGHDSVPYAEGLQIKAELAHATGDVNASIKIHREALNARISAVGELNVGTAEQMGYHADYLLLRGENLDFAEAEALCRTAMAVFEDLAGQRDTDYAWAYSYLAGAIALQGRHDEAIEAYEGALALKRSLVGERHVEVSNSLNALAVLKARLGRHDEAVTLFQEALGIRRAMFEPEHHKIQCVAHDLIAALRNTGRTADADRLAAEFNFTDESTAESAD